MRVPRLGLAILGLAFAGLLSGEALQITTTPSHTPTDTPTPTPTPTPTVTSAPPTAVSTPMPTPWTIQGPEFPVNANTSGSQRAPSVSLNDSGFVLVWVDEDQDGSSWGVYGRQVGREGTPGAEFPVATYTLGAQQDPHVASSDHGDFVVVWQSHHTGGQGIFARRFNSSGTPLGPEFMVNTDTERYHTQPDVAMFPGGSFVVVWTSENTGGNGQDGDGTGVFGRIYDFEGNPSGGEFQVNTYTTGDQTAPAVSASPFGAFVVVWQSAGQDGAVAGIHGQYFSSGAPSGPEFQVNTITTGDQITPDVGFNETGILATWASNGGDGSEYGIAARLFDPAGQPLGDEFQVNTHTDGFQMYPTVEAARQASAFVVSWQSYGQEDPNAASGGIYAQRFENRPVSTAAFYLAYPPRAGAEYQVNTYTTNSQMRPAVGIDAGGQFVIAWESLAQDGEQSGVFARRFGWPNAHAAKVDQRPSGGASNVNGVLEPGERVTLDPSWGARAFAAPLDLEGTASNMTGPPGPTYTIDDDTADYGSNITYSGIDCFTATGNCYEVSVSGTRPALHWDATLDETFGPPQSKTWALHVGQSFADVPEDVFYPFIENIFHNRVTAGGGCGVGNFCPEEGVLRQQMAVFVLKGLYGADFTPPPATGAVFDDVPESNPFAPWIEELAKLGIVAGCTAPPPPALPSYCPTAVVNRQQMAVFLVKSKFFDNNPSFCSGVFADVPCSNPFAPFVESIYFAQIAGGCQQSPEPLYCPTDPTKRKQMAVFLVKTFGLELYGPD
ncbi:MAG: hypothetical protein ABW056_07200 [Thermoanaerobaculia bacterium]